MCRDSNCRLVELLFVAFRNGSFDILGRICDVDLIFEHPPIGRQVRAIDLVVIVPQSRADRAFPQCKKASSIAITSADFGDFPFTFQSARISGFVVMRASPLMRSVSSIPGTRKSSPTFGLERMLTSESEPIVAGPVGYCDRTLIEHLHEAGPIASWCNVGAIFA